MYVCRYVWLGKHVSIGDNTVIEPGVVIYDRFAGQ